MIAQFIEKSPYHALLFGIDPPPPSKSELEKLANKLIERKKAKAPSWELVAKLIIEIASGEFGVHRDSVTEHNRKHPYPYVRMICYHVLRQYCKTQLQKIGEYFNRDHSTVRYSLRVYVDIKDTDKELRHKFRSIEKAFASHYAELCVA